MTMKKLPLRKFLYWIEERQKIYLKKEAGDLWPWTKDKILQEYKFTNVFREQDAVTVWVRKHWRTPYKNHPNLWFAMCVARQINWPDTLEELEPLVFAKTWNAKKAAKIMDARREAGKKVYTGAYMIRAESDPSKEWYNWSKNLYMTNIVLGNVWKKRKQFIKMFEGNQPTLQEINDWFRNFHGWGGFMSYEVVTDLRHTHYLNKAKDIYTWANPGPGAKRGLNRIYSRDLKFNQPDGKFIKEMQELLTIVKDRLESKGIFKNIKFEMRDIEHSLCEVDKMLRVLNGEGRPRSKYRRNE